MYERKEIMEVSGHSLSLRVRNSILKTYRDIVKRYNRLSRSVEPKTDSMQDVSKEHVTANSNREELKKLSVYIQRKRAWLMSDSMRESTESNVEDDECSELTDGKTKEEKEQNKKELIIASNNVEEPSKVKEFEETHENKILKCINSKDLTGKSEDDFKLLPQSKCNETEYSEVSKQNKQANANSITALNAGVKCYFSETPLSSYNDISSNKEAEVIKSCPQINWENFTKEKELKCDKNALIFKCIQELDNSEKSLPKSQNTNYQKWTYSFQNRNYSRLKHLSIPETHLDLEIKLEQKITEAKELVLTERPIVRFSIFQNFS